MTNLIIAFSALGLVGCSLFALWIQPRDEPPHPPMWAKSKALDTIAMWVFIFGPLALFVWWLA